VVARVTIKVLVPISGGKDSQSCAKLARMRFPAHEVRGLYCDTQFDHPKTYAHIERMKDLYGIQIDRVCGGSVPDKVRKYKRFPGGGARHCTEELKIRETRIYCKALAEAQGGFEVWYGMRLAESTERRERYAGKVDEDLYAPHEIMRKYPKYLAKLGVFFRLPVLNWTAQDVLDFLDGEENPLYRDGFDRVGCFPCLAAGDSYKEKAFAYDEFGAKQKVIAIQLSKEIGKSVFTSKGGIQRNQQTGLFDDEPAPCGVCAI
jgi:3'-phosphoadenosine 5'-phosphosulfate sulfotransferase (PAPS reductase)/FAD synthetase